MCTDWNNDNAEKAFLESLFLKAVRQSLSFRQEGGSWCQQRQLKAFFAIARVPSSEVSKIRNLSRGTFSHHPSGRLLCRTLQACRIIALPEMSQSEMTCTKNNEKPYFDSGNEFLFQQ